MSVFRPPPSFDPGLYAPWCRAWLHAQRHSGRLAELVQSLPSGDLEQGLASIATGLDTILGGVVTDLDAGRADDHLLLRTHACLRTLEASHRAECRRAWQAAAVVETGQGRYLLVPPSRQSTRPAAPERSFAISRELGVADVLALSYRWLALQAEDELDWSYFTDLHPLENLPALRLGLAPVAAMDDMRWEIDATEPRGLDRRCPMRCSGAHDELALWTKIESILRAAYRDGVHVLLMPELVVDKELLGRCRDWLAENNLREPRLRLVVAGSRHCDCRAGFANRCTVLDYAGDLLWEQEKRSPFKLENRERLDRLSPTCRVERAFEPTELGKRLVVAETKLGRILTPICLDYIEGDFWGDLGADIYLVPAMTDGLSRFRHQATLLGGRHGAATLVCNARLDDERCHAYRPAKSAIVPVEVAGVELFTVEIEIV